MKIAQIKFNDPAFRMFKGLEINIAKRITIIAGHNGIGKSTLLGLIANGSEMKNRQGVSLFQRSFQAQLHELFFLDKERDYVKERRKKPVFQLKYTDKGKSDLIKTCNVSAHKEKGKADVRLKVVPRGKNDEWGVGEAAKVPIPTLFLGMSRMFPTGEAQENLRTIKTKSLDDADSTYIRDKYKSVIDHKIDERSDEITQQELKGTNKRSLLPKFDHSSKSISLGQDSLSTIVTALASFNKLKREQGVNYKGGILLIDEVDAGFHPRVQVKLVELLKKEAKDLDLQIIMTTHSLTMIKSVLDYKNETGEHSPDDVVYIQDVLKPRLMIYPSYEKIKMDMLGELPSYDKKMQEIKVYFEDLEAKWVFEQILKTCHHDVEEELSVCLNLIAAKLGCDNLMTLIKVDNYFKSVLVIFDNDVLLTDNFPKIENEPTVLVLPAVCKEGEESSDYRTPECQMFLYLRDLMSDTNSDFCNEIPAGYTLEVIKDRILDSFPKKPTDKALRDLRKTWFNDNKIHFEKLNIIDWYFKDREKYIKDFVDQLKNAIQALK